MALKKNLIYNGKKNLTTKLKKNPKKKGKIRYFFKEVFKLFLL